MKYVLLNPYEKDDSGNYRTLDVVEKKFDVASPLFWLKLKKDQEVKGFYNPDSKEFVEGFVVGVTVNGNQVIGTPVSANKDIEED